MKAEKVAIITGNLDNTIKILRKRIEELQAENKRLRAELSIRPRITNRPKKEAKNE
jgi:prefoldin subunit 5